MQTSLLDSKKEYIDIILDNISIPVCNIVYNIYKSCGNTQEFQQKMAQIKNWNNHIISEHAEKILSACENNQLLSKLLKEIIVINIKLKIDNKKIDYKKIPIINIVDFIHKCLINSGIFCWKNAYLFSHKNLKPSEKQYHLNLIEKNIRKIIKITIRDCTPFDLILDDLLIADEEDDDDDEDDEDEEDEEDDDDDEDEEDEEDDDDDEDEEDEEDDDDDDEEDEPKKEELKLEDYSDKDEEEIKVEVLKEVKEIEEADVLKEVKEEIKVITINDNDNDNDNDNKNKDNNEDAKEALSDDYEEEEVDLSNNEEDSSDDDETEYTDKK